VTSDGWDETVEAEFNTSTSWTKKRLDEEDEIEQEPGRDDMR
jgi:hypothetical protein